MRRNSITIKLLAIIIGAFCLTTVCVLFLADKQLTQIIDESQKALYGEKVEVILDLLHRSDERLQKTGLLEVYIDDFQQTSLEVLRHTYFKKGAQDIYPFIIDTQGMVVLHPILATGDRSLRETEVGKRMLLSETGSFNYSYLGQEKWCLFKHFPKWNWVVGYTVPLESKYSDVLKFRYLLMFTMVGITSFVLFVLVLVVREFTRPIIKLTRIATLMAEGDLEQMIESEGQDEVGVLARSFISMRDSIRKTISQLKKENSERQKVEETLRKQNEYIKSIFEAVAHPLYVVDVHDYTIKMGNSASGFNVGDIKTCYELTHSLNSPCSEMGDSCPLDMVKKTHKSTMIEHAHYDEHGNQRNVEVYAYPVFDRHGELIQMIEYCIDVTASKQAQAFLADEKEQLSVTLRSIGDGVITTDVSGNIVLLNKVAEDLTGWSHMAAVGRPLDEVFQIINEQTREVCENPVTKVIDSGQIVGLANHTVLIAKNGTERSIADSGAPILNVESHVIGVVLVFRDVTEQIKTEQELLKIKKIESVGVLAGGIAHDFNNILAAILGNINLALFDQELLDGTKKLLLEAEKATLRAKDLTQQLLTFSKGGAPVRERASLDNVIRDSANFVLHGEAVSCRYGIADDLWLVDIDKGQISQVIQNIVLNACHALPDGGFVTINCSNVYIEADGLFSLAEGRNFVKISIKDNGIGMPADVVEKIFDPYFTTKKKGSGLGLAISQSIIAKHNGYISVDSAPGAGSEFTIYLLASERKNEVKNVAKVEKVASAKVKILVMDDEEMVRNVSNAMLVRLGHEVVLAADGEEALGLYKEALDGCEPFDVVIMDLTIPGGMGGKEAVQEILRICPEAKVVVSSGYSNDPIMADPQGFGFCRAIVKPFQIPDLSRMLAEVLAG